MKFVLIGNKIWSMKCEVTVALEDMEFNLGAFLFNVTLTKTHTLCCSVHFFNAYQTWERETALVELQLY